MINLCRLALGGQTVKNLRRLASTCIWIWVRPKAKQVNASPRKWVHGQTKRKLNASRKLALTCIDLWVHLPRALDQKVPGEQVGTTGYRSVSFLRATQLLYFVGHKLMTSAYLFKGSGSLQRRVVVSFFSTLTTATTTTTTTTTTTKIVLPPFLQLEIFVFLYCC